MDCIAIKLAPDLLENPDADIRYVLPDLLVERSEGVIQSDGCDYVGSDLVLYLKVSDLEQARACVIDVIKKVRVLGNDLQQAATVAVQRGGEFETIYPMGSQPSVPFA